MTRRHIELLAEAIRHSVHQQNDERMAEGARRTGRTITRAIKKDNPSFDTERFLKDCGIIGA